MSRAMNLAGAVLAAITVIAGPGLFGHARADGARILAYGDSNTWGWIPTAAGFPTQRLPDDQRWPGVLARGLGDDTVVVVDGLVGRRTDLNGATVGQLEGADFNGAASLPEAIARHAPLDLVIIMLGTNDLQAAHRRPPSHVAQSAFNLAKIVEASEAPLFTDYPAPRILIVAPPPLGDTTGTPLADLFAVAEVPSHELGSAFAQSAEQTGIPFFDAGTVTAVDGADGIHLTDEAHAELGRALVPVVRALLATE